MRFRFTNLTHLSIAGFVLYSPVSILAYPVSVLVVNSKSSVIQLTVIGIAITSMTFVLYETFIIALRKLIAFPILKFLSIVAIVGALRGCIFYWINDFLGLNQPSKFNERVISSVLTTLFWLSASNLIINISRNFRNEYQGALNQFIASQVTNATLNLKPNSEYEEINQFQKDLSKTLSELLKNTDAKTFSKISEKLTFHINEQLRPLSRRIWLRSLSEYPVINYRTLILDSIKLLNFSNNAFLLIMSCLAILNNLFLRSFTESISRTSTYIASSWIICKVYKITLHSKENIKYNYLFLVGIGIIPIFFSEFSAGIFGYQTNFLAASLITPIPFAVIIVLALFDLTSKDRVFLMNLLEKNEKNIFDQTSKGVSHSERELASYLHNSFQSELLALSGQLAAAAISKDKEKTSQVLQKVSAMASRSLSDELAKINEKPLIRLNSVIESWRNLLEIRIEIPRSFLEEKLNTVIFVQTVEEIASNTFRHSKGTSLVISAEPGDFGIKLYFQSDGKEPISKSKGIGKSWLNQVSLSAWNIEKNDKGTLVTVEI